MSRSWRTLERARTPDGQLELRRRGESDFLITLDGRVLMNSAANRSEIALAEWACTPFRNRPAPHILIGGLGMGCTLRAALDLLPGDARVHVAEINATVACWCRGPLADLCGHALEDSRVELAIDDVARCIARHAADAALPRFDAVLLDLYEGPDPSGNAPGDPLYGRAALRRSQAALAPQGLLAVWCEAPASAFERRLAGTGFAWECRRAGRGGRRHAVYLARAPGDAASVS